MNNLFKRSFRRGYSGMRPDILRMIDGRPGKILDIGSGSGQMALLLAREFPGAQYTGIENDPELANQASQAGAEIVSGNLDDPDTLESMKSRGPFDTIICADVLEHLQDPWKTLRQLVELLEDNGQIITSLPNVRHISTFWRLGVHGRWPRLDRGIHDRTHLHFFCRRDIVELGEHAGLVPEKEKRNLRLIEKTVVSGPPARLLDFWPFREFFTFQFLHRWRVRRDP